MSAPLKILLATHKPYPFVRRDSLLPVWVNHAANPADFRIQGDDEGDNISRRNPDYCELTAIYWAWKNLPLPHGSHIGLFHYRRYLALPGFHPLREALWSLRDLGCRLQDAFFRKSLTTIDDYRIRTCDSLVELERIYDECVEGMRLEPGTIHLPRPVHGFNMNLRDQYVYFHLRQDWDAMVASVREIQPDYESALQRVSRRHDFVPCNMFVMPAEEFSRYCEWLFSILSDLDRRFAAPGHPHLPRRLGFLAERLLNVYVEKRTTEDGLRARHLDFVRVDLPEA